MRELLNKKVLLTTREWFYGKDGKQYRAVHGTLRGIHEAGKTLGFIPNRSHANWFIEIGEMVIMGCQVMYLIECESVNIEPAKDWCAPRDNESQALEYERPSSIYIVS